MMGSGTPKRQFYGLRVDRVTNYYDRIGGRLSSQREKNPEESGEKRDGERGGFDPFQNGVLIFDGGMATEIYRNNVFTNRCFDELNLSMPELIKRIHQSYLNAGADVLTEQQRLRSC